MKTYYVTIPIAAHAELVIEAESEREAVDKGMEEVRLKDIADWEPMERLNEGNVLYFPAPWEPKAEEE